MKKILSIAGIGLVFCTIATVVHARGGGRAVGGGGGGRSMGGGSMGARPSAPSMNRSPSMSRPSAPAGRPAPSMNRGGPQASNLNRSASAGNRQAGQAMSARAGNMGAFGGGQRAGGMQGAGGMQAGQMGLNSAQSYQRPNQNQLGNFLNMPQQGSPSAFNSGGRSAGAAQQSSTSGPGNSRSYTTAGGSTITVGGRSGSGTTAGGATVGGAAGGIKVETAGGATYGRVGAVGGATDGTNSAIRGGSITGASDGQGNKAVNVKGGYADSTGYRQGGSITGTQNQYGYSSVSGRAGYGYGNGTGQVGAAGAVRGPAGNVVSAGRGAGFVNGQFVGGQTWGAVNGNYTHWNQFGAGYYGSYPNAWWPGKWAVATTAWATATYAVAGSYCGCSSEGTYYDYGENVTYEDGTVYQDGAPVATAEEYYQQADQIAASGQQATDENWMPLGVFAIVSEGQTQSDKVVQLALNKEGVIRGNFQDNLTDSVTPVTGSVDKATQRVAIKLTGNENLVVETGLYNLTNDEVPVLLHFGATRQEARTLIRLKQPEEQGK